MTNFNLYKIFLCVADQKNLTKASEILYVSQPAISNSIKELERELNVQLFIRKNKGVELTSCGEKLYSLCKIATQKLDDVEEYFLLKNKQSSIINIGVNTSNLNQLFYDAISELLKDYPNAEISIERYSESELYEKLENGKLNYIALDSEYTKQNLTVITEFNIEYQVIGNKKYYELYNECPLTIEELSKENLILANKSYTSRQNIEQFFKKNYISLIPKLELDGYSYVSEFVENGYGISIVNPFYFRKQIEEGGLFIINKNFEFPKRKIVFAKLKLGMGNELSNKFETIINNIMKNS